MLTNEKKAAASFATLALGMIAFGIACALQESDLSSVLAFGGLGGTFAGFIGACAWG